MSTRVSGAFHAVYMPIVGRTEALRLQWNCVSFRDAGEKAKEKKHYVCVFIRAIGAKCTRREEAARKDVEVDLFKNRGQRRWSEGGNCS